MTTSGADQIVLTEHQRRALARDRHVSVTANAGSGKTRVLVERYLDILLSGSATVREIVALTYTDRAASELRRKIAEEIARALSSSRDPAASRRLETIRNDLASAMIGTIHAFCARLLREHPVEADVDASFGILEGLDQRSLLDEAVRETFRRILRPDGAHALRDPVIAAIRTQGRRFVVDFVTTITERRGELDRLTREGGIYARRDEEILELWREQLGAYVGRLLAMPLLAADLEIVTASATGKSAPDAAVQFQTFSQAEDLALRAAAFSALTGTILTVKGELRAAFVGKTGARGALAAQAARLSKLSSALSPLIPFVTGPTTDRDHLDLIRMSRILLAATRQATDLYGEMKSELGRLDYEDLLLKTRHLLGVPDVRAQLSRRYAFVMIDEYQDTNLLQYEILLPLLDGLGTGNLFIVGDPKQSIYSFRQANVRVFDTTRSDIRRVSGAEGDLVLDDSFRPLRDLAAFVNHVFSGLMQTGSEDYAVAIAHEEQVRYEPLARARQNAEPGRVELLVRENPDDPMSEHEMVARRILGLVSSGTLVYDKLERPHPVAYRDIAVLLRTRGSLPDLEQAFIRSGVPYIVSSGSGYFQTQDIFDFYNYLKFLLNPGDDIALAGILRSPFFVVSDAELFEVAFERRGGLWETIEAVAAMPQPPPSIARAVSALRDDLAVALRYPVHELLARIVRRRHYAAKIAGTVRAAQGDANLGKLMLIARAYDAQGFATLFDFVSRLRQFIDGEEQEGQGSIESEGNAVQVMTVHAAKGLEFPVVILPHLHRPVRYDDPFVVDERLGIAFRLRGDDGEILRPPLTQFLQDRGRARAEAEEQRILYVACTRARDLLVLPVDTTMHVSGANGRDWLLGSLAPAGLGQESRLEFRCTTRALALRDGRYVPFDQEHVFPVHILRPGDLAVVRVAGPESAPPVAAPRVLINPVVSVPRGEIFSATKIRVYAECPSRYFLRYILGLPSGGGPFARSDDDELRDRDVPAELRGRIFHAVMQKFADTTLAGEEIVREVSAAFDREAPLGCEGASRIIDETTAIVRRTVESEAWREVAGGTEAKTEFTISISFGPDILTGTLDRVFRGTDGTWTIVDYKTDAIDASALEERAELYWPQIEFYSLLASRSFQASSVEAILLFAAHVDRPLRRRLTSKDLSRIQGEIKSVVQAIHAGHFAREGASCAGCPFAPSGCNSLFHSSSSSHIALR